MNKEDVHKWHERVVKLIAMRPRSEQEIKNYFRKKQIDPQIQTKLLEKLKTDNLLNDQDFASWWVEQRTTFKTIGKRAIIFELKMKGLSQKIIDVALSNFGQKEELELAQKLIHKKLSLWKNLSLSEIRQKIRFCLSQRGFSSEIFHKLQKTEELV